MNKRQIKKQIEVLLKGNREMYASGIAERLKEPVLKVWGILEELEKDGFVKSRE